MPFRNRVRLPLYLAKPQYPETRRVYTKSDGSVQVLFSQIRKTLELKTDYLPERMHERIAVALSHDYVQMTHKAKIYPVVKDGEYEIGWIDELRYPAAQAASKVQVVDFEAVNTNCQSCDDVCCAVAPDFTEVSTTPIEESQTIIIDLSAYVTASLCNGLTVEIVSINEDYVESATLEGNDVTIVMKNSFFSNTFAKLFTYAVRKGETCYDLGDVYENVLGTAEGCPPPSNLQMTVATSSSLKFTWDRATPDTGNPDQWELYLASDPLAPILTGTDATPEHTFGSLDPNESYFFRVRSDCGGGEYSDWIDITESTLPLNEDCGWYDISYRNFNPGAPMSTSVTYTDCNGVNQTISVFNFVTRPICAMQDSPGVPTNIILPPFTTYTYRDLC